MTKINMMNVTHHPVLFKKFRVLLLKILFCLFVLVLSSPNNFGQTTLLTGDIAFVGLNADGDDDFAFVLLKDITSGTVLYITDKGWVDGSGFRSESGDGDLTWTASSSLSAGTVVHIKTTNGGTISTESFVASTGTLAPEAFPWDFSVSYTGDQLFIYQGPVEGTVTTIIAGIHYNYDSGNTSTANWDGYSDWNDTSALPDDLTNGSTAVWVYDTGPVEKDNFIYSGAIKTGTPEQLRNAIHNLSNWSVDNSNTTPFDLTTLLAENYFTVESAASAPSATTNSATSVSSSEATLNGTVNDNGANTTVTFEYGPSTSYGLNATASQSPVSSGSGATSVSATISGLSSGTVYHCRVKAVNSEGTTYGSDQQFTTTAPEINLTGNTVSIADGDALPSNADHTDFGSVEAASGTIVRTFTIENTGDAILTLTDTSPHVSISGTNAADFSITSTPSSSISAGGSTTFDVTFDPSANGSRTATLSIANNDSDENPYNFSIEGTGLNSAPTDIALSNNSLDENVPSNTIIGAFSTTDPDVGDTHTYSLAAGTGDIDNGAFNINGSNLRISNSPNYEVQNSYNIRIRSSDQGGLFYEKQFIISINDINPPIITELSTTSGPAAGGTSVTITGNNFIGATAVSFGGSAASGLTINSNTEIVATSPAGSGSVNVTVTTEEGISTGTSFTYYSPSISSISPTSGSAAGGTTVTITGLNFTGATAVSFGGSAALDFTNNSDTDIVATSPAGSGTVSVTVTSAGGTSANGASNQFTYYAPPTVSTSAISTVSSTTATMGGNVSDNGGTTVTGRGVVYSITNENSDPDIDETGVTQDPNGSGTGSFSESIGELIPNTDYSIKAYAINSEGTSYGSVQTFSTYPAAYSSFTGPGNWSDVGNWSDGIPGNTTTVTVSSGTLTVDDDYECADMIINSGAVVSIDPNNTLTVLGTMTNNAGTSGLILQSDGTGTGMLINSSTGTNALVEQYLVKDQWHYIGIPISQLDSAKWVFEKCYLALIDESNATDGAETGWEYLTAGDALITMHGYAVQYNPNENGNDTTVAFSGTLNTGNLIINLDHTDTDHGWNLISNPYPCTMDWESGITLTNMQDAIYLWDPVADTYKSYVNGSSSNGQTQYIPPMQGFFVRSVLESASVQFSNSTKNSTDVNFKSQPTDPLIRLAITKDGIHDDETLIRVSKEATNQFDDRFDAWKIKATTSKTPQLYSVFNGNNYSINSIQDITTETFIPLEIIIKSNGEHNLRLKELTNYSDNLPINLFSEDSKFLTNLKTNDYSFRAEKGEVKKFILAFSSELTENNRLCLEMMKIYSVRDKIKLSKMGNKNKTISLYNINGEQLFSETTNSASTDILIKKSGFYFINVENSEGLSKSKKIIVTF